MGAASRIVGRLFRRGLPEPEVFVVSYPKCGRTWLRAMVGRALCAQFGLPDAKVLKTLELSAAAGIAPTQFVHDGAGGVAGVRWDQQDRDKSRFRAARVALLIRDPRDVVVSSYFQATRRMGVFTGTLAEFVRDDCFGIRSILAHYSAWEASADVPRDFLLLRYEDLHGDAAAQLGVLLGFMGLRDPDPSAVAEAVRFGAFENMRRLESAGTLERKLRPGDAADPESYKVRRGRVGGYVEYLGPEDLAYIERVLATDGRPFGVGSAAAPV